MLSAMIAAAEAAAHPLVDWTITATALLLLTAVIVTALRSASAARRHLVWGLGLAGVLLVPPLSGLVPTWRLPGVPPLAAPAPLVRAATDAVPIPVTTDPAIGSDVRADGPAQAGKAPAHAFLGDAMAPSAAPAQSGTPIPLGAWLIALWIAGVFLVLAATMLSLLRAHRLRRGAQPLRDGGPLLEAAERAARTLGLRRRVTVLGSAGPAMPMTWGAFRPIILLPTHAAHWSPSRLRAVLLHEMAHVKRHDYATQLAARLTCALYWFHPLVWVAARRLRIERELACDDLVLRAGSRASEYAGHLLDIARTLRVRALAGAATVAMARPSQLTGRLLAVLDERRARAALTRRTTGVSAVVAACLIFPLAGLTAFGRAAQHAPPAVPPAKAAGTAPAHRPSPTPARVAADPTCDWSARGHSNSSSYNVNDDQTRVTIKSDDCRLTVEAEGKIAFTDDDADIASISNGGYFDLEERGPNRERRRLLVQSSGGRLQRTWQVNGTDTPYGADAKAWLARVLPAVFRRTGLNAEARAKRILDKGGMDALLTEIRAIPSDYVARRYFAIGLAQPHLDAPTVKRIVQQAGDQLHSDYELATLLVSVAKHQPVDETVREAYVEAAGHIGSDYERRRALSAVLARTDNLSTPLAAAMLKQAKTIGSDYELASLLIQLVKAHPIDETLTPAFVDATEGLQSDYELHRVYSAVLQKGPVTDAVLQGALQATGRIGSDYERAQLLLEVASKYPTDKALPASFLEAARTISSDYQKGRVLSTLVTRDRLGDAAVRSVLEAAGSIGSDYERARLLVNVAQHYQLTGALRDRYVEAARSIGSEYERGRALAALFGPQGG